ncbi:glycosyltransferase involved in cell wall biosynthesis [Pedobacter sp. UYEF25]
MNKKTIIYIGGFELPDKNAAAQRVIANAKLLRALGYDVVFDGLSKERASDQISQNPVPVFGFDSFAQQYPKGFTSWLGYVLEFNRYVQLIKKYPDTKAIICYNLPSGSIWRLLNYCKKNSIQLISDCTEWYAAPKQGNIVKRLAKKLDINLRMNTLQPKLDGIIAISDFLTDFYQKRGVRTIKVPPLVDVKDEKWINAQLDNWNVPIELLYAGSPFSFSDTSNVKDRLDLILEALIELSSEGLDFRFQVIGVSKEDVVTFFPNLSTGISALADKVKFHGKLPHQEAVNLLKKCDYSIFLRDKNIVTQAGFPTKFVESISCGIPVLTNKNSNVEDYLIAGENGYWVDMSDGNQIKESLKKALTVSEDQLIKMKQFCHQSHTFDYRKYLQLFEDFLNPKIE